MAAKGSLDNFYQLLNVAPSAPADEIKKAIHRELRVWSNRVNAPQMERRQEAERMVQILEQAERILLDTNKRAEYDRQLSSQPNRGREIDEAELHDPDDLVAQGWNLLIAGNVADALYVATRATQIQGGNAEAWALLAQAKFRWGDVQDAIYEYKRAIQLCPNQASYYFDLGSVYESAQLLDDAFREYGRAAQIDPACTMFRAALGAILVKQDRPSESIDILARCVQEEPDNDTYQWFLAIAYHDCAYLNWTLGPNDDDPSTPARYATAREHVEEAHYYIQLAEQQRFNDPDLSAAIHQARSNIDSMLARKFHGNQLVAGAAILLGAGSLFGLGNSQWEAALFGIGLAICGILYIVSCMTPQYILNERILAGGGGIASGDFLAKQAEEGCFALLVGLCLLLPFLPIMILINFARNYSLDDFSSMMQAVRVPRGASVVVEGVEEALPDSSSANAAAYATMQDPVVFDEEPPEFPRAEVRPKSPPQPRPKRPPAEQSVEINLRATTVGIACRCGKRLQVALERCGKKVKCPACDHVAVIPPISPVQKFGRVGEVLRLDGHTHQISSVAFSPDGRRLVSAGWDTVRLWDVSNERQIRAFGEGIFSRAVFSPNGRYIAASALNLDYIPVWDATSGTLVRVLEGHAMVKINSIAFSPNGRYVLSSGGFDRTMRVWNIATGKQVCALEKHTGEVNDVAFSPNGKLMASAAGSWSAEQQAIVDCSVRIWDVKTRRQLRSFEDNNAVVECIAFFPSGRFILSGSYDGTIRVWDIGTGKDLRRVDVGGHVGCIAVSPDGLRALAASEEKLMLMDLASGLVVHQFHGHGAPVNGVAFSPGGDFAVSCAGRADDDSNLIDCTIRVWELPGSASTRSGRESRQR